MRFDLDKYAGTVADYYTYVDGDGQVLRPGNGGILVFSERDPGVYRAILAISEVSDEDTVNLFLDPAGAIVPSQLLPGQYELLV